MEKSYSRTLVIGDIHGGYKAMMQCFERSKFDYQNDRLICLGDVADGWPEVDKCFNELFKIKNLVYVIGNHDAWLLNWFLTNETPQLWLSQGGIRSVEAYDNNSEQFELIKFLNNSPMYFVDERNNLYVHGGYDWHFPIENQSNFDYRFESGNRHSIYNWDRHLFEVAIWWDSWNKKLNNNDNQIKAYNKVFIGHTSTSWSYPSLEPIKVTNIWNLDQGGGYEGKLTIMDVDTEEYWQSDLVGSLYPGLKARK
jgi:serine/threonine protein phosphatase 1